MWKERLWQVFLVIILGFVLTMCNRSASNNKSLNAESTSTVTVESLPTITLANAGQSAISHTMMCIYAGWKALEDCVQGLSLKSVSKKC